MLSDQAVLIVEDNPYLSLDLSAAVEEMNGTVVGPVCWSPTRCLSSMPNMFQRQSSIANCRTAR